MFIIYLNIKFQVSSRDGLLINVTEPKVKDDFRLVTILPLCLPENIASAKLSSYILQYVRIPHYSNFHRTSSHLSSFLIAGN
jgi:hypothetical protein